MIFRHAAEEPTRVRKRFSPSFVVSVGVHAVVATALMRMLILHADDFATTKKERAPEAGERVSFVAIARPGEAAPTIGPLVGSGGLTRGIRPTYSDPRLWQPPAKIVAPPKSVIETIDGLIAEGIKPYNDSVAMVAERRDPTDWTVEKGGYKWGIDKRAIRLGPVSIPTALLALLPLNLQGNPMTMDRDRTYAAMYRDITWHAQQGINEADFAKAVRSIRERKERERAAALVGAPGAGKDQVALPPR